MAIEGYISSGSICKLQRHANVRAKKCVLCFSPQVYHALVCVSPAWVKQEHLLPIICPMSGTISVEKRMGTYQEWT